MHRFVYIIPFNKKEEKDIKLLKRAIDCCGNSTVIVITEEDNFNFTINNIRKTISSPYFNVLIYTNKNKGAGYARNYGMMKARELKYTLASFLDYDDTFLETSKIPREKDAINKFNRIPNLKLIFSNFVCVDTDGYNIKPPKHCQEILNNLKLYNKEHKNQDQKGTSDMHIQMLSKYGYLTLTSGVTVNLNFPSLFPNYEVSEDYSFFCEAASKGKIIYTNRYIVNYTITQDFESKYNNFLKKKMYYDLKTANRFLPFKNLTHFCDKQIQTLKHCGASEILIQDMKNIKYNYENTLMQTALAKEETNKMKYFDKFELPYSFTY